MRKVLKWVGRSAGVLLLVVVVTIIAIYAISEYKLRRTWDVTVEAIPIPTDAASIAEGKRKARILGCSEGCHGPGASGRIMFGDTLRQRLLAGKVVAPDLTRVAHELSDRELVRVIRHGVLPDGRSVSIMPSGAYYDLSDEDLGQIIAYLRSLPLADGPKPVRAQFGLMARLGLVLGTFTPDAAAIDHDAPRLDPGGASDPIAQGRYLTHVVCAACHGRNLSGDRAHTNLTAIADYTPEQFRELMRTTTPPGKEPPAKPTGFQLRFAGLTQQETDAMYLYLTSTLADEQVAQTSQ